MRYLIRNASIIDPAQRVATVGHVLIEGGRVTQLFDMAELAVDDHPFGEDVEVIYAQGCVIAPGFTDLHTHLHHPNDEDVENIATVTLAAARGGFTTVCAMPGTTPMCDSPAAVRHLRQTAMYEGCVHVDVIGALTSGCAGTTLTEMIGLIDAGCVALSNDDLPVSDAILMRNALSYATMLGIPVLTHCEDNRLNAGWAMHEGIVSVRLGLPGYPAAAEEVQIARDIALSELTGAHLHICHVSTAGGVQLIREAKARGVNVTAEVTPHHLTLTDRWVLGKSGARFGEHAADEAAQVAQVGSTPVQRDDHGLKSPSWLDPTYLPPYDPSTRVTPPLRSERDIEALLEGILDNTIDAIATDHMPHSSIAKLCAYGEAPCGISGLETALGLVLTLVHNGMIDLMNVVAKLTEGPARILGRSPASLRPGSRADLVVFDPESFWVVDTAEFVSRGKSNPLQNQRLKGQVMLTMWDGNIVFRRAEFGRDKRSAPQASRLEGILSTEE